jgi:hypothetical protein
MSDFTLTPNPARGGQQTITLVSVVTLLDQQGEVGLCYIPDRHVLAAASWDTWVNSAASQPWDNWESFAAHVLEKVYNELLPLTMTVETSYVQESLTFHHELTRDQPGYTPATS